MRPIAAALFAVLLAATAGEALAGSAPPPGPAPGLEPAKPPKGWLKCAKCGNYYPPDWVCCCPVCGKSHPKNMKCRPERKAPRREAACPVCKKAFNGPLPFGRNDRGGMDRDFCRHSLGHGVVESLVWMCPRCGYARFCPVLLPGPNGREIPGEFNKPVPAKLAAKLRLRLEPLAQKLLVEEVGGISPKLARMIPDMDQTDIPDWIKYELALQTALMAKAPAVEQAKLALEGAYACRRELLRAVDLRVPIFSRIIPVCEGAIGRGGGTDRDPRTVIKVVADLLKKAERPQPPPDPGKPPAEQPRKMSLGERFYYYLRLAGCWDRVGQPNLAASALEEARKTLKLIPAKPEALRPLTTLVVHREKVLRQESEFRAAALTAMRKALIEDRAYPDGAVMPTVYLLGELYRRQGEHAKARAWLVLFCKLTGDQKREGSWAADALKLPRMSSARPEPAEEAAALEFLSKLTGKKPSELVSKEPPKVDPATVAIAPQSCARCLANIAAAYAAYVAKHKKAPRALEDLVKEGLMTEAAAAGFKCPECGAPYRYRCPREPRSAEELILWHHGSRAAKCKKLLYADGSVRELK